MALTDRERAQIEAVYVLGRMFPAQFRVLRHPEEVRESLDPDLLPSCTHLTFEPGDPRLIDFLRGECLAGREAAVIFGQRISAVSGRKLFTAAARMRPVIEPRAAGKAQAASGSGAGGPTSVGSTPRISPVRGPEETVQAARSEGLRRLGAVCALEEAEALFSLAEANPEPWSATVREAAGRWPTHRAVLQNVDDRLRQLDARYPQYAAPERRPIAAELRAVLGDLPKLTPALLALARWHADVGEYEEAQRILEDVSRFSPHLEGIGGRRADLLCVLDRSAEALDVAESEVSAGLATWETWRALVRAITQLVNLRLLCTRPGPTAKAELERLVHRAREAERHALALIPPDLRSWLEEGILSMLAATAEQLSAYTPPDADPPARASIELVAPLDGSGTWLHPFRELRRVQLPNYPAPGQFSPFGRGAYWPDREWIAGPFLRALSHVVVQSTWPIRSWTIGWIEGQPGETRGTLRISLLLFANLNPSDQNEAIGQLLIDGYGSGHVSKAALDLLSFGELHAGHYPFIREAAAANWPMLAPSEAGPEQVLGTLVTRAAPGQVELAQWGPVAALAVRARRPSVSAVLCRSSSTSRPPWLLVELHGEGGRRPDSRADAQVMIYDDGPAATPRYQYDLVACEETPSPHYSDVHQAGRRPTSAGPLAKLVGRPCSLNEGVLTVRDGQDTVMEYTDEECFWIRERGSGWRSVHSLSEVHTIRGAAGVQLPHTPPPQAGDRRKPAFLVLGAAALFGTLTVILQGQRAATEAASGGTGAPVLVADGSFKTYCPESAPATPAPAPTLYGWVPGGEAFIGGAATNIVVASGATGERLGGATGETGMYGLAASPGGDMLLTASCQPEDEAIRVLMAHDGRELAMSGGQCPRGMGVLADGRVVWRREDKVLAAKPAALRRAATLARAVDASADIHVLPDAILLPIKDQLLLLDKNGRQTASWTGPARIADVAVGKEVLFVSTGSSLTILARSNLEPRGVVADLSGVWCTSLTASVSADVGACLTEKQELAVFGLGHSTRNTFPAAAGPTTSFLLTPDGAGVLTTSHDCEVHRWTIP